MLIDPIESSANGLY